jgi:1-acyl-sn-glycerol-3-phosphate acyltransferase
VTWANRVKHQLVRGVVPAAERRRLADLEFRDAGHGFDVLGLDPVSVTAFYGACLPIYERYFRVASHGSEHIPQKGAAILAANHSGLLPIDAAMLLVDVLRHTSPPRVPRAVGDVFIPLMPWVGTVFSRLGMVSGSHANVRHLLDHGELVLVFPEGTRGIGKGFGKRYQLQEWHVGHAELALEHAVMVIPVAVVGAEESWPQLARLDRIHAFGAPFLPIPATPLPLPTRFHVHDGSPIALHERWAPGRADDPRVAREAADMVRDAVQALIARGLASRRGLFR